jgi:hypothetical protein
MSNTPEENTPQEEMTDDQIREMLQAHIQPLLDHVESLRTKITEEN